MKLSPLDLPGAWLLTAQRTVDERGSFARLWCRETFERAGVVFVPQQMSASVNRRAGTLRGMHFARPPARESKIVRCVRGRVHDVLLDLRPHSPAFGRSVVVTLEACCARSLLIPPGVAHGFQTLADDTELHYVMDEAYRPELAAGIRHDDPRFGLRWPLPVACLSERDRTWPDFDELAHRQQHEAASPRVPGAGHAA